MKQVYYVLLLCTLTFASIQVKDYIPRKYKIDDKETLEYQLKFLLLFKNEHLPEDRHFLSSFTPNENLFKNFTKFSAFVDEKWLKKGEIFSILHQPHLEQAILLFRAFYHTKTVDDMYKVAAWSQQFVNERMWSYALSVALVHKPETFGIILPPDYEINPYLYFNSELMAKIEKSKNNCDVKSKNIDVAVNDLPLERYTNLDAEHLLTYFTEDVGLNFCHYSYSIIYPWWMDGDEFGLKVDHRGELFYYIMAQLVARYNAERLSNGLGEVTAIDFTSPLDFGYYPGLSYPNGAAFPSRPEGVRLNEVRKNSLSRNTNLTNSYIRLRDAAFRIQNVLDLGRAYWGVKLYDDHAESLEVISNLLEGNPNSLELPYYGTPQIHGRHLLGYAPEPLNRDKPLPAATEHYETALRDPATWRFFKWLLNFYDDFYKHFKPYTRAEMEYPGVNIDSIDATEIVTYFENFTSDLSQYYNSEGRMFIVQKRLNHLPFTYNISVSSNQDQATLIKVFLGPKYNHRNLKSGSNVITRTIDQKTWAVDRTSYRDLLESVTQAYQNKKTFVIDGSEAYWSFPGRLLIPRGTKSGMEFQLYIILIKLPKIDEATNNDQMYKRVGVRTFSGLPLRFPLDREIGKSFFVKNSFLADVTIRYDEHYLP
ncbi:hypothetical protein Trydic_g13980 [Trypoxylus dichotomus]